MLDFKKRKATKEEQKFLKSLRISIWMRVKAGIGFIIFIIFICIIPLAVLDAKFQLSPEIELKILIPIFIISIIWAYLDDKKWQKYAIIEDEENVIEIDCQCKRAAMLEDPEDFGNGYFIEGEEDKTLFLMTQRFYEIEFPNTHFQIVLTNEWREIIEIKMLGQNFEPEIILKMPSIKEWGSDDFPKNGDVFNKSLNQIIIERENM